MNKIFVETLKNVIEENDFMKGLAYDNENVYFCYKGYYLIKFDTEMYKNLYESKLPFLIGKYNEEKLNTIKNVIKTINKLKGFHKINLPTKKDIVDSINRFEKGNSDYQPYVMLDYEHIVNAYYLKELIILLGGDINIKATKKNIEPIMIKGKNGLAVLSCVRLTEQTRRKLFGV